MTIASSDPADRVSRRPIREPGVATVEEGMVLVDGPEGLAITLTPQAARALAQSLLEAAERAAAAGTGSASVAAPDDGAR